MSTLDDLPDEELVRRSQARDQGAFVAVFLRYKTDIYVCLRNVIMNDAIAEDLWQDTYIKAWRHIRDLREPSRFKAWVLTIARRLAFDRRKKDDRERCSPLGESGSTSDPIDYEADPQVMVELDMERFVAALAQMDPVHREMLLLDVRGFSRAEIAQMLGYKEGTVVTYLSHARRQFRVFYYMLGKIDGSSGKEQNGVQADNASMPGFLNENDHSQESHCPNENRKEI